MRAIVITAAIITSAIALASGADKQVGTIRPTPNPEIAAHIEKIQGSARTESVSIKKPDSSQSKPQQVTVRGPISQLDISALVFSAVAGDEDYWKDGPTWDISIDGDGKYAIVHVAMNCGWLCGGGASYTYAFRDGKWNFEYTSHQWVS